MADAQARNLRIKTGKVRKFVPRYVGPFVVEAKINANAYRLTLPANMSRLHPVFHVSLLKKYSGSDVGIMPPPVEWMDETPVYYVERLLDHRYTRAGKAGEYLVQWEGYDASFNTWEPRANLTGCDKLLAEYNAIHCLNQPQQQVCSSPLPPPLPHSQPQQQVCSSPLPRPLSPSLPQQQRRAPAAGVQLSPAPAIRLLPTPAAGGQHQHNPPVQHHGRARRGQWAQVGTSTQAAGTAAGGQQYQHQKQDLGQALIQYLIQKVDTVQNLRDVYQPHELEQCRRAALAHGLTIFQLPQLAIDMAAVVAASILITRVYNHMVFSSVNANSKTQYGTGQRVQVVLAKSDKNSSGDLDTTLTLLTDKYNAAVYSALTAEKKKERRLNRKGEMVTTLAEQLAQAQAPHTDFLPVGPGMDDGLVFLLALQDFPLVAYMGSHKLSQLAAAHCWRTADGKKQVVELQDMDALALTLPHQLGTEVLVKAGQLVLFRGNTVHAGNVGVAGSCCARLYGFGRPDTVADNTTMNTSELGDLYHGLFQPIQDEGIGPKMADWNRRGMAGQWDPVDQDSAVWSQDHDPVGVRQNPVDVWRRTL
ncbi:hypothetical protein V8C86DRAFT_3103322 [Haematococcus lacustris]